MEELYRALYSKYAGNLSQEEIDTKIGYALQQDPNDFVNAFYQKYTGSGPSQDQLKYISSIIPEVESLEKKSQEDVSWFDQTWFGRGIAAASTTGEATDLMAEDFSNVSTETIQEFMKAKEQEAKTHVPSERMEKFQKQYQKEGKTWAAFFRGVRKQPGLLPELFVQSLGTQIGTAFDSPGASLSAAGTGALAGGAMGGVFGGIAGAMGGLATSMEAALTFGELIETELKKEGKEFSDKNIKELLEGPKGKSIRNKAIGRGLAIGTIEGFTGGLAGKAALATKGAVATARAGKVGKRGLLAAGAVGTGVEAIGGGTGEIAGRLAADQEMDPAEIGFEAITGTVTAPINVGGALLMAKDAKYYLNDMKNPVTYAQMKDFVETADDIDVAKAKIKIENDFTGLGKLAKKKQNDAIIKSQIDDKITDQKDRETLVDLAKKRDNAKWDLKKEGVNQVPGAEKALADIESQINDIISKYEGATDVAATQEAADVRKARRDISVSETIAFAETKGNLIGKDVKVVDNDQAAQEAADKLGYKGNVQGSDGFIIGDSIIINKDVAGRKGAINVGAHELLHGIMAKHLKSLVKKIKNKDGKVISEDKTELKKFVSDFKNFLSDKQRKWIENEIITNYQDQIKEAEAKGENFLETTDEWFNKFIDGIATEQITYDESSFSKLKSFFERIFRKFGYNKEFGSGRQTYDFLKDYQQSAAKGELSARAQAVAGVEVTSTKPKKEKARYSDKQVPVKTEEFKVTTTDGDVIIYKATTRLDGTIEWTKKGKNDTIFVPTKVVDSSIMQRDNISPRQAMEVFEKAGDKVEVGKVGDYKTVMNPKMFDRLTSDQQQRVDPKRAKEVKGEAKFSKSNVQGVLEEYGGKEATKPDLRRMVNETLMRTPQGKETFDITKSRFGLEIEPIVEAITQRLYDKIPSDATRAAGLTRADYKNALVSEAATMTQREYNPTIQDLDKFISNRLNNRAESLAKRLGVEERILKDVDFVKETEIDVDVQPTPKPKPTKKEKPRVLKSLADITLDNKEIISATARVEIQNLIKQNPKNLEEQLTKLIEKNITKAIQKQMGGISFKNGEVIISEEYKAFMANNYSDIVQSLDVNTIKNNYKTLFDLTKIGKEDKVTRKEDKPTLKKDSYYRKDIYKIETNKAKFTKFFIDPTSNVKPQSHYNKLRDRQYKLALQIANGITEDIINNEIINTSSDIDVVIKAEITNYANKLNKQKNEVIGNYADQVKFSKKNASDFNALITEAVFGDIESARYQAIVAQTNPRIVKEAERVIGEYNLDNQKETAGFKQRIKDNPNIPQEIKEKYFSRLTNKNHQESIDEMTDFTTDMAAFMDPEFVLNMYEDMFGFQYRYADKNRNGQKAYNKIQDTAKKQKTNSKFKEIFGFDPETAKQFMYNSKIGIMNRINTVLKKAYPTIKEKLNAVLEKEGKNIEQANKQNPKVLEYIITKAIQAVNKNSNNMVGVLRWLESATNTVKGLRALTGLTHIDIIAESQEASTKHPDFKRAKKDALKRINESKKTQGLKESVKEALAKEAALKKLNTKGEHLTPSANLMEKLAEIIYKYSKLDMTDVSVLSKFKSELRETTKDFNQALGNKNTFDIVDNTMGPQAEGDVRLITGLKDTGRSKRFYHISGAQSVGYIARTITQSKEFKKLSDKVDKAARLNNAVKMSRSTFKKNFDLRQAQKQKGKEFVESILKKPKGITVLDFDDTLATTKSLVRFTAPDGTTGTLNAEEYASTYQDLLEQGYTFDFSEFNKVVKGKIAPLFQKALKLQKKFGPESMFVLTARPPAAQKAIFDFLKANGLNIPIKNITGLGNSTSEAKALWVADKVGEGFNDFYFADDALQNVQAVKNMLDQFDVKSKVQQAKVKFSKSMNNDFNKILEDVTGIESKKRFSAIKARKRGESKGKFRFFIPPSHEDFVGLLYNFMGKGKRGNEHRNFFEEALIRPLNRAYRELNAAKQSIANDYKSLNKQFADVKKKLTKKTPDGDFTYQDAIRVYLFDKHGHEVPGLSSTDQQNLVDLVMGDPELQTYAETLNVISRQDKYVAPTESWEAGDIRTDLDDATGRIGRKEFFTEFNDNSDIIFSQENLNKIEAAYGADVVSAIKDMLYRIQTGQNRPSGQNALVNKFLNYLNGSVASTMFFNIRSAVLQQMSMVNFINFADNNIIAAAKAFANQKQYWTDWATIFNSDFMKQRRKGIQTDVNGAELAASVKNAKNPVQAAIKKLLELGFLPTQIGDNIAIATGGATFLRNRINTYLKQGLSQKEAEAKAFVDFEILAEATQQSARPDMVSQQQASPLGKVILAFQNVTSQFNRLGKKAFLDLKNRRITPGNQTQLQSDMSNLSRIAYYFAIQNLVFYSLQSALFMMMFDDDKDDEKFLKKKERMINGSIDSVLRGSGVWGAAIATLKNMAIKWHEQRDKGYNADESAVLMEMLNVSPPLGIKARKLVNAEKTLNYNKKTIDEMETFDIDNPQWSAYTNYIESTTNVPLNRLYNKTMNVRESLNNQHSALERALMFGGWSKWNLGIEDVEKEKKKQGFGIKKKSKGRGTLQVY